MIIATILIYMLIGAIIMTYVFQPIRSRPILSLIIISLGASIWPIVLYAKIKDPSFKLWYEDYSRKQDPKRIMSSEEHDSLPGMTTYDLVERMEYWARWESINDVVLIGNEIRRRMIWKHEEQHAPEEGELYIIGTDDGIDKGIVLPEGIAVYRNGDFFKMEQEIETRSDGTVVSKLIVAQAPCKDYKTYRPFNRDIDAIR